MPRQVVTATVSGLDELLHALDQMPQAVGDKAVIDALRSAAQPVVRTARRLAPVATHGERPGTLRRSIKAVQAYTLVGGGRSRRRLKTRHTVLIRAFAPHAHLVELGTAPRQTRSGAYRGRAPAQPFMRPAWAIEGANVKRDISRQLWQNIARQARRYAARSAARTAVRGRP